MPKRKKNNCIINGCSALCAKHEAERLISAYELKRGQICAAESVRSVNEAMKEAAAVTEKSAVSASNA